MKVTYLKTNNQVIWRKQTKHKKKRFIHFKGTTRNKKIYNKVLIKKEVYLRMLKNRK